MNSPRTTPLGRMLRGKGQARLVRSDYARGVDDTIAVIEERGRRIGGAIQPTLTVNEIRKRLLGK